MYKPSIYFVSVWEKGKLVTFTYLNILQVGDDNYGIEHLEHFKKHSVNVGKDINYLN